MNLLILLGFGIGALTVLWVAQSCLLFIQGAENPVRLFLNLRDASPILRLIMQAILQMVLLGILLGFPLAVGQNPIDYHVSHWLPPQPERLVEILILMMSFFVLVTIIEIKAGWVQLISRYPIGKTIRKVFQSFISALTVSCVEEGIFRGIILEQMILVMPGGLPSTMLSVVLSALIFSAAHFIRSVKTYFPAVGLFVLGCLLGMAYVVDGHGYWLPIGLHAGGILGIKLLLPFVEYRGPTWLIGFPVFPFAGAIGIGVMMILGMYLLVRFEVLV